MVQDNSLSERIKFQYLELSKGDDHKASKKLLSLVTTHHIYMYNNFLKEFVETYTQVLPLFLDD